jgi:multiple sugar transport system permease protein
LAITRTARGKTYMGRLARHEERAFYLFIMPWLVGFVLLSAGPILISLALSFGKWDILGSPTWVGTANWSYLFTSDKTFYRALLNTAYYTFPHVILMIIAALLVALLLDRDAFGIGFFRTSFYLPSVLAGPAIAMLWMVVFHPDVGLVNRALWLVGIQGPGWFFDEKWAMPTLIIVSIWPIGSSMIIFLAGLRNIPEHLYEAAMIDGANGWQRFWKVTLPLLSSVIFYLLIRGVIGSFQVFTLSYIMTAGGPNNATLTYILYLYRVGWQYLRMGQASAMAWVLFVIIMLLTLAQFQLGKRWVYYESGDEGGI